MYSKKKKGFSLISRLKSLSMEEFAVVATFLSCVAFLGGMFARGAWVDEQRAIHTLQSQGWSNVHVTDKRWLFPGFYGCDSRDAVMFTASATNPSGHPNNSVIVCMGLLKGGTIRTP